MFVSYAQNFEDVMLWRTFKNVEKGFYIDIGAQDPVTDSVSMAFYENGWRGVHVEPVPYYADRLRLARPDETIIQAAVARKSGLLTFFEIEATGLSTADPQIAEKHRAAGYNVRETAVPCLTLNEILDRYRDRDIHWMKIDVEGLEAELLQGWQPSEIRPWVIVVESTLPNTQVETHMRWEPLLTELGYSFVYFDGLNRFYVSKFHQDIKNNFKCPPNFFDYFTLSGKMSASFCVLLNNKLDECEKEFSIQLQQNQEKAYYLMNKLTEQEGKIHDLQANAEWLSTELDQAKAAKAAVRKRNHELEAQNEWLKDEFGAAKTKIQELNDQVHHWWVVADGFNRELQSVYSSWSWCLTKPLRWMNPNSRKIFRYVKSFMVYTVGLPRQIARKFLETGLTHMRRHPQHKARLKSFLARWPRLQARLYVFASARKSFQTVEISTTQSNSYNNFDLSAYPVSVRTTYRQLMADRSRVEPKREEGENI